MSTTPSTHQAPPSANQAPPSANQALRHLFLTLFLRGRGARGLKTGGAPRSVGQKLALTLLLYAAVGVMALVFVRQPVFALSVWLHAMTFMFLGMFVASSAGEILFNAEEADILLHRPVSTRALLWAKVRVLVEVSLWLAGALNLAGLVVGIFTPDGGVLFPVVHAASTVLEALFCTGTVILAYQLCLRWFGRERLDSLMTIAQIVVAVAAVLSGQILPQLVFLKDRVVTIDRKTWWIGLLPPAWFAGFDDALAGTGAAGSFLLAGCALVATALVLWSVFGRLARDYESGLRRLNESVSRPAGKGKGKEKGEGRRWIDVLADAPPIRWWLPDPVSRASFLLVAAYLTRDRDVKLRVYPALAPMLVLPILFMAQQFTGGATGATEIANFSTAFIGGFLGVIPMMAIDLLKYSQQWRASDVFRAAPVQGPGPLCHGARRAVLLFLVAPLVLVLALLVWLPHHNGEALLMLLPGVIAMPVFAVLANAGGCAVPLSLPSDEAKATGRGLFMVVALFASGALSVLAVWFRMLGWFWPFLMGEVLVSVALYVLLRRSITRASWTRME